MISNEEKDGYREEMKRLREELWECDEDMMKTAELLNELEIELTPLLQKQSLLERKQLEINARRGILLEQYHKFKKFSEHKNGGGVWIKLK